MANITPQEKQTRQFLNSALMGKFVDAMIAAIASGDAGNQANTLAVKENLFLATATGQFLDRIASGMGVTRPAGVGIDDPTFAQLTVDITNNKLISNIFLEILELFYGETAIKANTTSVLAEPFHLQDGMTLQILQDSNKVPLIVTFNAGNFNDITNATAEEIANVISQAAFNSGYSLTAQTYFDSTLDMTYVQVISGTRGPKSSITITGGNAQNYIDFPELRPTTQLVNTQFTSSIVGSNVRFTWTGGPDPSLQFISSGDYVNLFGAGFLPNNQGSYTIIDVTSGSVGNAFFEIQNPAFSVQGPVTLASPLDVTFFKPIRNIIQQQPRYASVYEVNPYEVVCFLPATTQIVKRSLIGSAHLHGQTPDPTEPYFGPYLFDPKHGFSITENYTMLNQNIEAGQVYTIVNVQNANLFPDGENYVVFDYGTSNQEGPVRYFSRPSSGTILLDPSYKFQKSHSADMTLIFQRQPYIPDTNGDDYGFYVTGTVEGRQQAINLINSLSASGIFLNIIVVYPNGPGMNNIVGDYGPDLS